MWMRKAVEMEAGGRMVYILQDYVKGKAVDESNVGSRSEGFEVRREEGERREEREEEKGLVIDLKAGRLYDCK